jgi:hypothetical protein
MSREALADVDTKSSGSAISWEDARNLATLWVAAGSLLAVAGGALAAVGGAIFGETVAVSVFLTFFAVAVLPMTVGVALFLASRQRPVRAVGVRVRTPHAIAGALVCLLILGLVVKAAVG